jgi:hypothetical protein
LEVAHLLNSILNSIDASRSVEGREIFAAEPATQI